MKHKTNTQTSWKTFQYEIGVFWCAKSWIASTCRQFVVLTWRHVRRWQIAVCNDLIRQRLITRKMICVFSLKTKEEKNILRIAILFSGSRLLCIGEIVDVVDDVR